MKKHLIVFTGHLAALKTTISKRIAQDLDILCLNKDDIKEVLGDAIGFKDRAENIKLTHATFDLMVSIGRKMLDHHDHLILEANFKAHEIKKMNDVFADVHITTIFLTASVEVLYQRYLKRQPLRHLVHTSTGLIPYDVFLKIIEPVDESLYVSPWMCYDTSDMDEKQYQIIKRDINNVISKR